MTATDDEIAEIAADLLASWHQRDGHPFLARNRRKIKLPQLAVTFGLTSHTYYVAAEALDLLRRRRVLASLPLVRACYESAISAQWVAQTRDGYAAFINEELRQRANLAKTLAEAASEVFKEAARTVTRPDMEHVATETSARRFDLICGDLRPGGIDAYVIYRSLSHQSHPSVLVVDQYLEEEGDRLSFRLTPDEPEVRPWLFLVATSLVWAGRALDYMDGKHVRRNQLRDAARRLQIAPELHLTDDAILREQRKQ